MRHESWLERADGYAVGALEGEERARFEDHLAEGCADCEQRLVESREAMVLLTRALPRESPAEAVKQRVFEQLGEGRATAGAGADTRRSGFAWSRVAGAVAAMAAMLLISFLIWDRWTLTRLLVERDRDIQNLQSEIARRKEVYRLLEDPSVRAIALAGQAASPAAVGRLLWRADDRTGLLLTRGLPEVPEGMIYELWAIGSGGPVPAGLFSVDERGRAQHKLPALAAPVSGSYEQFAVTLEPEAGSPLPTGPMHLSGSLGPAAPA
jgi:anti-sigma-K factor RskA